MIKYSTTKFFRTFSAESYPVEPRDELAESDAQALTTYYEARYDAKQRLREFVKHLRQRGPNDVATWTSAFVERYDYWPSGRIMTRSLVGPDGSVQTWNFDDLPFPWTTCLSRWFENLSGNEPPTRDVPSVAERICACHAVINEMESALLRDADAVRNVDWAFRKITESLPSFKALFEILAHGSSPRVSFLASAGPFTQPLSGFDELLNLGGIMETWHHLENRPESAPIEILTAARLDSIAQNWLKENNIASAYAVPIRVCPPVDESSASSPQDSTATEDRVALTLAELVLWLRVEPTRAELAGIVSIFQRQAIFIQLAIRMAPDFQSIWKKADESTHPRG